MTLEKMVICKARIAMKRIRISQINIWVMNWIWKMHGLIFKPRRKSMK